MPRANRYTADTKLNKRGRPAFSFTSVKRTLGLVMEFYPRLFPAVCVLILFSSAVSAIPAVFTQKIIAIIGEWTASGDWETTIPTYTFPTFLGTIYDGSTFEPLDNASVTLKLSNGKHATMMDASWSNPCKTFAKTSGTYSFWVAPEACMKEGETREFSFTLDIEREGYTPISYSFSISLVSKAEDPHKLNSACSLKVQDLFMFREEIYNEQE